MSTVVVRLHSHVCDPAPMSVARVTPFSRGHERETTTTHPDLILPRSSQVTQMPTWLTDVQYKSLAASYTARDGFEQKSVLEVWNL